MSMTASFQLNDLKTGKTLLRMLWLVMQHRATDHFMVKTGQRPARERFAILLAQRVVRRLQLYF